VGQPASIEGPYAVDDHTLLLLHLDGSYDGAQGEPGTPNGTGFDAGKYGQGLAIDDGDTLSYQTAGNLERTQGAVEFWIRPNWEGGDNQSHTFFEVGDGWFNRMRIMKDGANNLRFLVWDSTAEYGVAYNVAGWQAGEWHHVAATWQGTDLTLFADGRQRDSSHVANPPDSLAGTIHIGSSHWSDQQADAVLDELRISDVPRIGASGIPYRFLVVDSGNHRLQAFDELGNFVSAYGEQGSGPGQFQYPEGVAVDGAGRVIVADRMNNRLQVLAFDGTNFSFVRTLTAGFSQPTGVAVSGDGRIAVADWANNRVVVLSAVGDVLAVYSAPNDGYTGPFALPYGVAWDSLGNLAVADMGNRRVVTIRLGEGHRLYLPLVLKEWTPPSTTCQELIQNGSFEEDAAWAIGITPRQARYTTANAHSGGRSMLLGFQPGEGDVTSYSSVRQSIALPAGSHSTTLSFWIYTLSDLDAGDRQECLLLDEDGDLLAILMRANDSTAAWTRMSYDLGAYAGQTVQLYFNAYNDGDGQGVTGFFLDDVSVESCTSGGQQAPW
jgi:DNA-binding beta-propeller fold protein YncE